MSPDQNRENLLNALAEIFAKHWGHLVYLNRVDCANEVSKVHGFERRHRIAPA